MSAESYTDVNVLLQELIRLLEQSESETDKIRVLKSMGNCGSKELIPSINRIIEDKSQPIVVRSQAVFALRKIAKPFPKLVCLRSRTQENKKALLSHGEERDAAVNFEMYRSLQWHRAVVTAIARLSY